MSELTIEPITRNWYRAADDHKLMGRVCKKCGHVEFPPVPICNECGSLKTEWVELSGKGTLMSCSVDVMPRVGFESWGPLVSGFVHFEEGPDFVLWVVDLTEEEKEGLFDALPVPVEVTFLDHGSYRYPAVRIAKE